MAHVQQQLQNDSLQQLQQVQVIMMVILSMIIRLHLIIAGNRATVWQSKCKLHGILTNNAFSNMLLLITFNSKVDIIKISIELHAFS